MTQPHPLFPDEDGVLTPHAVGLVQETNEQYHAGPGISKSHLDAIKGLSPRHYWHRYLNPNREPEDPTPALLLGSAVHSAILEPDDFKSQVIESPGFDRRSNSGKAAYAEFYAKHAGKIVLEPKEFAACIAIRDAVHSHPVASGLLRGGRPEQSFYAVDKETGELIKCRTDYIHDSGAMIVDVKTTDDASPDGFGKSSANFRYPVQTAWYHHVLDEAYGEHPEQWVFLAVEKNPPYAIGIYFTEHDVVTQGAIAARRDFLRIVEHRRSGVWPDYGMDPQPLKLPAWAKL